MDNGHFRYFGDHKAGVSPDLGTTKATPLLLFRAVSRNGRPKGLVEFCDVGIIERAERVVQWTNGALLAPRYLGCLSCGPSRARPSPRIWSVSTGTTTGENTTLKLSRRDRSPCAAWCWKQLPRRVADSQLWGWRTDVVGRLDIGSRLAGTSLVVLGQAKYITLDSLVSAEPIARVVAWFQRGWIGVYVPTAAYSVPAQTEMVEDQYPIVLINGIDLVTEKARKRH